MKKLLHFDELPIEKATLDSNGFLRTKSIVTRVGIFQYFDLFGNVSNRYRPKDEVFNTDSLESLKLIPVTNDHPKNGIIDPNNATDLSIGYTGESIEIYDNYVVCNFVITDSKVIKQVLDGEKTALSLGYYADLNFEDGVTDEGIYDSVQTNIRYNHLALVDIARAGDKAKIIVDSHVDEIVYFNKRESVMSEKAKPETKDEVCVDSVEKEVVKDEKQKEVVEVVKDADYEKEDKEMEQEDKNMKDKNYMDEIENMKKQIDTLTAERDALREKLDGMKQNDSLETINQKVKDKLICLDNAYKLLGQKDESLIALDNLEIKTHVLQKVGNINLDGKTADYINAYFDIQLDQLSGIGSQRRLVKSAQVDNSKKIDYREKMIADLKENSRKKFN